MDIIVGLLLGWSVLFATNSEFFNKVEELKEQGHEWKYTGKQFWKDTGDNPAILIYSSKGTKPRYYWSIGELEHRRVK